MDELNTEYLGLNSSGMPHHRARIKIGIISLLGLGLVMFALPGTAQERWFQIEVSVFSNESQADRSEETWYADKTQLAYPQPLRRLDSLLQNLMLPEFLPSAVEPPEPELAAPNPLATDPFLDPIESQSETPEETPFVDIGPFPARPGQPWRLPDPARDPFLQLSAAASDFRQTNRALERDPGYRLLFHGLWRQPMPDVGNQTHLFVSGGYEFGDHQELEGSLGFYFNNDRTRIVADANLWLSEFRVIPDPRQDWQLPDLPGQLQPQITGGLGTEQEYHPVRIYHLQQQREMRSEEFHYLDHPALGLVVTVTPYEVPLLPEQDEPAL